MVVVLPIAEGSYDDRLIAEKFSVGVISLPILGHENFMDGVWLKGAWRPSEPQPVTRPAGGYRTGPPRFLQRSRRKRKFFATHPDTMFQGPAILGTADDTVGVRPEVIET